MIARSINRLGEQTAAGQPGGCLRAGREGGAARRLERGQRQKEWHGLRRSRLRGLPNVNIDGLMVAAGQNLKRLLARRGWGRRPFPAGATGIVLPTLPLAPAPTP